MRQGTAHTLAKESTVNSTDDVGCSLAMEVGANAALHSSEGGAEFAFRGRHNKYQWEKGDMLITLVVDSLQTSDTSALSSEQSLFDTEQSELLRKPDDADVVGVGGDEMESSRRESAVLIFPLSHTSPREMDGTRSPGAVDTYLFRFEEHSGIPKPMGSTESRMEVDCRDKGLSKDTSAPVRSASRVSSSRFNTAAAVSPYADDAGIFDEAVGSLVATELTEVLSHPCSPILYCEQGKVITLSHDAASARPFGTKEEVLGDDADGSPRSVRSPTGTAGLSTIGGANMGTLWDTYDAAEISRQELGSDTKDIPNGNGTGSVHSLHQLPVPSATLTVQRQPWCSNTTEGLHDEMRSTTLLDDWASSRDELPRISQCSDAMTVVLSPRSTNGAISRVDEGCVILTSAADDGTHAELLSNSGRTTQESGAATDHSALYHRASRRMVDDASVGSPSFHAPAAPLPVTAGNRQESLGWFSPHSQIVLVATQDLASPLQASNRFSKYPQQDRCTVNNVLGENEEIENSEQTVAAADAAVGGHELDHPEGDEGCSLERERVLHRLLHRQEDKPYVARKRALVDVRNADDCHRRGWPAKAARTHASGPIQACPDSVDSEENAQSDMMELWAGGSVSGSGATDGNMVYVAPTSKCLPGASGSAGRSLVNSSPFENIFAMDEHRDVSKKQGAPPLRLYLSQMGHHASCAPSRVASDGGAAPLETDCCLVNPQHCKYSAIYAPPRLYHALHPHQWDAIQFIWSRLCGETTVGTSIGSVRLGTRRVDGFPCPIFHRQAEAEAVSPAMRPISRGCVLAHSMQLGKKCTVTAFILLWWMLVRLHPGVVEHIGCGGGHVVLTTSRDRLMSWTKELGHWLYVFMGSVAVKVFLLADALLPAPELQEMIGQWVAAPAEHTLLLLSHDLLIRLLQEDADLPGKVTTAKQFGARRGPHSVAPKPTRGVSLPRPYHDDVHALCEDVVPFSWPSSSECDTDEVADDEGPRCMPRAVEQQVVNSRRAVRADGGRSQSPRSGSRNLNRRGCHRGTRDAHCGLPFTSPTPSVTGCAAKSHSAMIAACRQLFVQHVSVLVVDSAHKMVCRGSALASALQSVPLRTLRLALTSRPWESDAPRQPSKEWEAMLRFVQPAWQSWAAAQATDQRIPSKASCLLSMGGAAGGNAMRMCHSDLTVEWKAASIVVHAKQLRDVLDALPRIVESTFVFDLAPLQLRMLSELIDCMRGSVAKGEENADTIPTHRRAAFNTRNHMIGTHCDLVRDWCCQHGITEATTSSEVNSLPEATRRDVTWAVPSLLVPSVYDDASEGADSDRASSSALASLDYAWKMKGVLYLLHGALSLGEKVVVFSHSVRSLVTLGVVMQRGSGFVEGRDFALLSGSLSVPRREELYRRFNDPNSVLSTLLLSFSPCYRDTVDISGANRIFFLDTSCSAATEQRIIHCVHRLASRLTTRDSQRTIYVNRVVANDPIELQKLPTSTYEALTAEMTADDDIAEVRNPSCNSLRAMQRWLQREFVTCVMKLRQQMAPSGLQKVEKVRRTTGEVYKYSCVGGQLPSRMPMIAPRSSSRSPSPPPLPIRSPSLAGPVRSPSSTHRDVKRVRYAVAPMLDYIEGSAARIERRALLLSQMRLEEEDTDARWSDPLVPKILQHRLDFLVACFFENRIPTRHQGGAPKYA